MGGALRKSCISKPKSFSLIRKGFLVGVIIGVSILKFGKYRLNSQVKLVMCANISTRNSRLILPHADNDGKLVTFNCLSNFRRHSSSYAMNLFTLSLCSRMLQSVPCSLRFNSFRCENTSVEYLNLILNSPLEATACNFSSLRDSKTRELQEVALTIHPALNLSIDSALQHGKGGTSI